MRYIEGADRNQGTYWAIEDKIEEENMVRVIDRFIETSNLAEMGFARVQPSEVGRPGYAPGVLMKLYLYGYSNGIRSSRKLEKEAKRNIEVMWLMQGLAPDHSTIATFRRSNAAGIRALFRSFVMLCKSWKLTDGAVVAQDGSKISASSNLKNQVKKENIDARIQRIDEKINAYLADMDEADKSEKEEENPPPKELLKLLARKKKLEEAKQYMEETGEEETSLTDPDARIMGSISKGFDIAYNMQMAVDSKEHIVVACDVVNNPTDRGELTPLAEQLLEEGHVLPNGKTAYLADKGYYSGDDFNNLNELDIIPIVPKQNPPHAKDQPPLFWSNAFAYDKTTNTYTCPMGHTLYPAKPRSEDTKRTSYYNKEACKNCPQHHICISGKTKHRVIRRGEHADICDVIDDFYSNNKTLYNLRRELAEHPFGTIKRCMNGSHFLLRTLPLVKGEAALFYLAYNIKRASNALGFKEIMAKLDARLFHIRCFFTKYDFLHTKNLFLSFFTDSLMA
jgi:transposase